MPTKRTKRLASQSIAEWEICFDRVIDDDKPIRLERAAMLKVKKWPDDRRIINCHFLDGDAVQRKKVEAKAHIWEEYANIKFNFGEMSDAEIRISFSGRGSSSAVGTDALDETHFPKFKPTMNFGWLKSATADEEYERVVLHEFGHALGLIHEHQNPDGKLEWKKDEVYSVYSGPPNYWSKEKIDRNILTRYSPAGVDQTHYDPDSIMLYMFPGFLFVSGEGTKKNFKLSQMDKDFIAQQYPF